MDVNDPPKQFPSIYALNGQPEGFLKFLIELVEAFFDCAGVREYDFFINMVSV